MLLDLLLNVYRKIDKHRVLFPKPVRKQFDINGITMYGDMIDPGFMVYPKHYDETVNNFYKLVAQNFNPDLVIDIGANYGFVSCIMAQYQKNALYIAIEPNKRVFPFLCQNLKANVDRYSTRNAVCGDSIKNEVDFYLNPRGSQDSRVIGKIGWKKQVIPQIKIDSLIAETEFKVFIKTDTQGYEKFVYDGGKMFFDHSDKWLMRMEFCPVLFRHHDTDTIAFLIDLISKYDVVEIRSPQYNAPSLDYLFANPLSKYDAFNFITYVNALKEGNIGWTDILIRPKK
jgi:FkbM family methyltransferase